MVKLISRPSVQAPATILGSYRRGWSLAAGLILSLCCTPAPSAARFSNAAPTEGQGREVTLSLTEGTWMSVDVSPDGKTIVFDLLGDLYSIPAGGGEARLLQGGTAMQRAPKFSPDGQRLLFISDAAGSDNIWTMDLATGALKQISTERTQLVSGPTWSHDGSKIAAARMYSGVDKLHSSELRLYDLSNGSDELLVAAPANGENVHEAAFSPDGRYLYYTEKVSSPAASVVYIDANHIHYAVKRRDLATGATEEVVKGFGSATTPTLSPDGKHLAFVRRVKDRTVLFLYDIVTREQKPIFDRLDRDGQSDFIGQGNYYPQYDWFPDSRHIAIWAGGKLLRIDTSIGSSAPVPFRVQARHRLNDPSRVTQNLSPAILQARSIRHLAVGPAGKQMLFNGVGRLWQQRAGDRSARRLSGGDLAQSEPAFSSDGRKIAYAEWNDEEGGTLKLRSGNQTRTLVTSRGAVREPVFSPEGRDLLYKIDVGDRCLGGYQARPGLYSVPVRGGESRFIAPPAEAALFSPDGTRIYFTTQSYVSPHLISKLESVKLDGSDRREHAATATADASELRVSPDLRWIAFRDRQQYYIAPLQAGEKPMLLSADQARKISKAGGYELTWSPDSKSAFWLLGPTVYRYDVEAPQAAPSVHAELNVQVANDHPSGKLAFVNGRVITMEGNQVIERGTVVVDGNRIVGVGPVDEIVVPKEAKVIDASGKTIMPGLVDMHGHIDNCYYTSSGVMPQKQATRYASLAYGVTTNYDPYSSELPTYSMSEMTKAGLMVGPRAIDAGMVAYGREGKSDAVFIPLETYQDAAAIVARKKAVGGTIIKSYRQPMRRQRQLLLQAARDGGVMVDVEGESHFHNNLTMILDGHTNLQHNMPVPVLYDDVVQLMANGKVAHTPTLIALFGELMGENYLYQNTRPWQDPKAEKFVQVTTSGYSPLGTPYGAPPYVRGMTTIHVADELWDIGFRAVARSMKKLDDAGVIINAGSHGQISGLALHWEMWLLSEGGMSNHRVLRAATINGARTLALDRQIGSIEPGKLADLIVLDRNPLDDIRATNSVRYTLVNGRLYDAHSMNEIGNHPKTRSRFYWETGSNPNGIDWNSAWAHE